MKWNVTNALNRDVERQHLNKILAEIQSAVDGLVFESKKPTDDVRAIVGSMVEGNTEEGVIVTYNPSAGVLDFAVNDFIVRLTGDVTGQATITGLNSATIATTIDPELLGIPEAPEDNEAYWRRNAAWERVPYGLYELANVTGSGFAIHNADEEGEPWLIRQLEVVDGELTLANPDAVAGNPLFGLADLPDSGVGTSPVQLFTRDSKGRVEGTEDASTDDLPEGVANLYFTEERAQDAVGTILGTTADVALAYDDSTPAITATLPSKGQPDGLATLDSDSKLTATQLPALAITDTFVVADEAAMLALTAEQGDVAVRTDEEKSYILTADPASTLSNWQELLVPTGTGGTVTSVASGTGLTGGPITSTGTLSLNSASIASLALADSALQSGDAIPATDVTGLATVATTGVYSDLSGRPTLGTAAATAATDYAITARGLPSGGSPGQQLVKNSSTNYDTRWSDPFTGTDARAAVITNSISSGDFTHAPSGNAVFNALTGKASIPKGYIDGLQMQWVSDTALTVSSGAAYIESAGNIVQVPSAIAKTALSLAVATWYHVYLYLVAGAPDIEISTTAPEAYSGTARRKTGDPSRRYVGSFKTLPSTSIIKFTHSPASGEVNYLGSPNAAPLLVVSAGNATVATTVSCANSVPLTARIAKLLANNNASGQIVYTSNSDAQAALSTSNWLGFIPSAGTIYANFPLDSSQAFNYIYDAAPVGGTLFVRVVGYTYER